MSESLLREMAVQMAHEQFLLQWPIYLLMAVISLVIGFAAAYIGVYAKKRGDSFATKADFDKLVKQVNATTAVGEEIKARLYHADWASREEKALRRIKLEELLQTVHELQAWQEMEKETLVFNKEKEPGPSPLPKLEQLCGLYFPELKEDVNVFTHLHREMMIDILNCRQNIILADDNLVEQKAALQQFVNAWPAKYREQLMAVAQIETQAREILQGLVGVKRPRGDSK